MSFVHNFRKQLSKSRYGRQTKLEHNGYEFTYIYLERFDEKYIPFPARLFRDAYAKPMIVAWNLNGKIIYTWYRLILGLMAGRLYTLKDNNTGEQVFFIHKYYVKPLEEFNEQQMQSILDGSYDEIHNKFIDINSQNVYLFKLYRDRFDGKRYHQVLRGFQWYFIIESRDYDKMIQILDTNELTRRINKIEKEDDKWLRVYATYDAGSEWKTDAMGNPVLDSARAIIAALKDRIPLYEADLKPHTRYAIDFEVKIETNLKVLYYDIETDDTLDQIVVGRDKILSIAGIDRDGNIHYNDAKQGEEELLDWFSDLMKHYDIVVGWNNYNFDDEYIIKRLKGLRERNQRYKNYFMFQHRDYRVGRIDMMKRVIATFGRLSGLTSFSLEAVSQHFLGRGKVKFDTKIIDLYKKNPKLLKEYNIEDANLLKDLDAKTGVVDLMIAMCEWTGSFPTLFKPTKSVTGISIASLLDMFILRRARQEGIHFPTAWWEDRQGEKFQGALIMDPTPGIYKDVYIFDFKSLYPTIIWSWRISPENKKLKTRFQTKEPVTTTTNKLQFYKERTAIFPMLVEELMSARKVYKQKQFQEEVGSTEYEKYSVSQQVAKELTNALYGQIGQRGNRYFDFAVAESVPAAGRYLLRLSKKICEEANVTVIYGDTDSVFVTGLTKEPQYYIDLINNKIKEDLSQSFNVDKTIVEMEYEKRMGKFISVMKKTYAGILTELDGAKVDKLLIKGLECIKRSTIPIATTLQKELLDSLLRTEQPLEYYIDWVSKQRRWFYTAEHDVETITLKTSISKLPSEFKTKQAHVRVAEWLIDNKQEFYVGMQVPYIIVDKVNKIEQHPDHWDGKWDKEHYWQKIYKPLQRVLIPCFPDFDWVQYDDIELAKRKQRELAEKKRLQKLANPKAQTRKQPRCPDCGYCKCRCEIPKTKQEIIEKLRILALKPRFIIKKNKYANLFDKGE